MQEIKKLPKRFVEIGDLKVGKNNNICDVPGVLVGHYSLNNEEHNTGITAVLPHGENLFKNKVQAASFAYNGFGKSIGLLQIDELGTIETPILLTNTLNVGKVCDALVDFSLKNNPEICVTTGTVNPVVMECNDSRLNNIREIVLGKEEVTSAITSAKNNFSQGGVGAGSGMVCHGLKGGIGSSSRIVEIDNQEYHLGVLVNSNFGSSNSRGLIFKGRNIGEEIYSMNKSVGDLDKGSIIIIIATDIPLDNRQLKRVAKRAALGLARTGSFAGNGSGDVFLAFTTANTEAHFSKESFKKIELLRDDCLEKVFKATVFATEEAILNSLLYSKSLKGYRGEVKSISEYKNLYEDLLIKE